MLARRIGVGRIPAKCNRGLYRLSTDTGTWTSLERGLPEHVEVRCLAIPQPGVVFAGTQAGPTGARTRARRGQCLSPTMSPWCGRAKSIRRIRVSCTRAQDMAVYRSDDSGEHWRRLTVPTNPDGLCVMGFPTRMIRLAIDDQPRTNSMLVSRWVAWCGAWMAALPGRIAMRRYSHSPPRSATRSSTALAGPVKA